MGRKESGIPRRGLRGYEGRSIEPYRGMDMEALQTGLYAGTRAAMAAAMTCAELTQVIVKRIITRAQEEPDPIDYFSRAAARIHVMEQFCPIEKMEAQLLEFGREFGLLVQGIERE